MDNQNYQMQRYGYGPPGRGRPHWQNDNSHLIPMPSVGIDNFIYLSKSGQLMSEQVNIYICGWFDKRINPRAVGI